MSVIVSTPAENIRRPVDLLAEGLGSEEVEQRLKADGYNELPAPDHRGLLKILFEVIRQPMFALLLGGGIIYLLLGDRLEAVLLMLFASFSVTITIVQESRSERVLEALRNLASPRALVIRDGKRVTVAGREVVRGDVMLIAEGDRVAADSVLLSAQDLLLDESLLTGESVPVRKVSSDQSPITDGEQAVPGPGGDGLPFVFAGSLVVRGAGTTRVQATGLRSEMGKIGRALQTIETEQPQLQWQIRRLVRDFAIFGMIAGGTAVLLYGLLRGSWLEAMLSGIALGMSLLPEEFPLVMAVFMAMGAWRISQVRVLTRRASAIESLGSATVLCTDKTGTLTQNRMTVVAMASTDDHWSQDGDAAQSEAIQDVLASALAACPRDPTDPMDVAVHALAGAHIAPRLNELHQRKLIRAYGLRADLFAVANVLSGDDGVETAYAKGALEAISELCGMSAQRLLQVSAQADVLADEGIRVLGVARAVVAKDVKHNGASEQSLPESLREMRFDYVGLIGFADPLRENVPAAVAECRSAGIRVVMITGDYPATACAIARKAGLDSTQVVSGEDIDAMSDETLNEQMKTANIFARIRPNQKLRIVQGFKASGEVVAMTGDGVNDAPAIKAAHIGIAMGGRGTDVAREASAIVLLDDDFGSIVKTIRLGRRIYDNLQKAIEYIVAVHIPIAGLAILPLLFGLPLILTPIHIAFLEMVIDPACSVVFEAEEEEDDVMRRAPRDPKSSLLQRKRIVWALLQGSIALAILAGVFISAARMGMPEEDLRSLVFASLVLVNMGLILVNRSFKSSLVRAFLRPNRSLWILLGSVTMVLAISVFWPPAQALFHFGRLNLWGLSVCAAVGVVSLLVLEWLKSRWFRVADIDRMAGVRKETH